MAIILVLKIFIVLLLVVIVLATVKHMRVMARLKFYENQNVKLAPGCTRPFIGNLIDLGDIDKQGMQEQQLTVESQMMEWLAHKNGEDRFEAHKYPMVAINLLSVITLKVSDPVVVQDLYTKYNSLTDKRG